MGRGGVETKGHKGACYWVWNLCDKILACFKKDPSCFRKHPEQWFLRPDLNFFLEFLKFFWFAISVTLKMTIQNYFFVKNVGKKKSPIKFHIIFFSKKGHKGACYLVWNLCDKILACLKKDVSCLRKHLEQWYITSKIKWE